MSVVNVGGADARWLDHTEQGSIPDGWYRGETTNFYPRDRNRANEYEVDQVIQHVVKGWEPKEKILRKSDLVTAFGSCFARHVEGHLRYMGFTTSIGRYGNPDMRADAPGGDNYWSQSLIIKCGEGFVNTFSIRTQFEWIFDDKMPDLRVWEKSENVIREYVDSNKAAATQIFNETNFFIITLGLSEVWYDKSDGKVLWTGVPKRHFDPDKYGFRVTDVSENLDNLRRIVDLIRSFRGDIPIVFTLSPVPLNATFRNVSCITASSVSKAILRVAIDELMRQRSHDPNIFYFPSYEIVTSYLQNPWDTDSMHPNTEAVELIMSTFVRLYATEG